MAEGARRSPATDANERFRGVISSLLLSTFAGRAAGINTEPDGRDFELFRFERQENTMTVLSLPLRG